MEKRKELKSLVRAVNSASSIVSLLPVLAVLLGCGSNPPPASNLNGDWQLAGDPIASSEPAVSVVLSGSGNQISGTGVAVEQCPGVASTASTISFTLYGSVDPSGDGFFSAASDADAAGNVMNLRGFVPQVAQQAWSGTYSLYTPLVDRNGGPGCLLQPTASFQATPIAPLSGTFTGSFTGSGLGAGGSSGNNISISLQIAQSSTLEASGYAATASLTVTGSPCFKSGTQQSSVPGTVIAGDAVASYFRMDDGSEVEFYGTTNASGGKINGSLSVEGGTCDNASGSGLLQLQ